MSFTSSKQHAEEVVFHVCWKTYLLPMFFVPLDGVKTFFMPNPLGRWSNLANLFLPETNKSHLKIDAWNTNGILLKAHFQAQASVSFREGNIFQNGCFHDVDVMSWRDSASDRTWWTFPDVPTPRNKAFFLLLMKSIIGFPRPYHTPRNKKSINMTSWCESPIKKWWSSSQPC